MFKTEIDTTVEVLLHVPALLYQDIISNPVPASTMWAFHRPRDSYTCCIPPSHSVLSGTAVLPHSVNVSFIVVHLLRVVLSPYTTYQFFVYIKQFFFFFVKQKVFILNLLLPLMRSKLPLM